MDSSDEAKPHTSSHELGNGNVMPVDEVKMMGKEREDVDGSSVENGIGGNLSPAHREYLLARHGTLDLAPLPTMDPADPLNWPSWKVCFPSVSLSTSLMAQAKAN